MRPTVRRLLTGRPTTEASRLTPELGVFTRPPAVCWLLVVTALLADIGLTIYGRQLGLVELNPVARALMETHGAIIMAPLKGSVVLIALAGWSVLPEHQRWLAPLSLAVPWTIASGINLGLIVTMP